MSYSDNHLTNELCLIVINDGNGSQCGTPYQIRYDLMMREVKHGVDQHDLVKFWVRSASLWLFKMGIREKIKDIMKAENEAVEIIHDYYITRIKEDISVQL